MAEDAKYFNPNNLDNLDSPKPENPPTFNFNPAPLQYKSISPKVLEKIKKEAGVRHAKQMRLIAPILEEIGHLMENINKNKSEVAKILLENIESTDKLSKIKNLMLTWVAGKISDPTPTFSRSLSMMNDKDISDIESQNFVLKTADKLMKTVSDAYSYHTSLRDILISKDLTDEQKVEEIVDRTLV